MIQKFFKIFFLFSFAVLYNSCANQLPPSGGEDDREPPKVSKIIPANNTLNYKGNSITFVFNEYVNRRSFEESFKISPAPNGRAKYDWGGKEVEVVYEDGFKSNTTYSVVITKELKDVNGSNALAAPLNFAFSTGSTIDKGKIEGKIFADNYDRMIVAAYTLTTDNENKINPDTLKAAYITQPDANGQYSLLNLPPGKYRLFAFTDDDRNYLYNKTSDKIAVLHSDAEIKDTSGKSIGNNFLFKNYSINEKSPEFLNSLKSDSLNIVYASIENFEKAVPVDNRFYISFRNAKLSKVQIADNLTLRDSAANSNIKIVFNWINDTLVQVFPAQNLAKGKSYILSLKTSALNFERYFTTVTENQTGTISGSVSINDSSIIGAIKIELINKRNFFIRYSLSLNEPGAFKFEGVPEGEYTLFAFIDLNNSGVYDYGKYYPYEYAEPFFVYEKDLKVKGMWTADNVLIQF